MSGRQFGAWSLAVALMGVNAACGGYRPPIEGPVGGVARPEPIAGTPLTRQWTSRIARGPSGPVALDSARLYVGAGDRQVLAVELRNGVTRWSVRLAGPVVGGVVLAGRRVYAASDRPGGKVYAWDAENGNQAWATRTGYVDVPLTVTGGRVFALTRRGLLMALDAKTGDKLWQRPVRSARIALEPLPGERLLITGYDSLQVVAQRDGRTLTRHRAPGAMLSPWVRHAGALLTTTGDSLVVALDDSTLAERWRVRLDAPLTAPPTLRGDTIYAVTRVGTLYRVLPGSRAEATLLSAAEWPATGAPVALGDWVLVGSSDGALRAFTGTGQEAWRIPLGRPFELPPIPLPGGDFLALGGRGDLTRITP